MDVFDATAIASATEATGLIPSATRQPPENTAYEDIIPSRPTPKKQ